MKVILIVLSLIVVGIIVIFICGGYNLLREAWQESTSISDFCQRAREKFRP